jgi:two-component system, chemotaxis family, CheB/CheR fusion protein
MVTYVIKPEVKHRIFERFRFALKPGGFLFLGTADGMFRRGDLFEPISGKWRFFRRCG